jgi:hypothetical protein
MITTDGKQVWTDNQCSNGFVPKDRAEIYYKIRGKTYSRKQVFNERYLVRMGKETLPF